MNVKSPNNTSKWQMGFNSAFKGLKMEGIHFFYFVYNGLFYNSFKDCVVILMYVHDN
jgi:hypothetical protein